ncbi:MAG: type II toxin-antitoxin system death-on-curing family toxin [Simkaniaceae bacterium]|nr:type II toxin-antitoxin system death-on-curing family toxin [Simkaniaceae bacterium]
MYFLSLENILEIHSDQIQRYGGRKGIRDRNLLISALSQPKSKFGGMYLHGSIELKAAAYLFHLCQNHPFIDGNKRVALVSMLVFLDLNKYSINFHEKDLENLTMNVAKGKVSKSSIALFISENT